MSSTATTPAVDILNYVNGAWRKSTATEFVTVINPASGELIARTPMSTKADVDAVVQAAAAAFPAWRRTPAGERI
jgi:malonate-semialdehyde dehydrogenase (acetylating) / methylmalonate-semialdehyde dehydrogenase